MNDDKIKALLQKHSEAPKPPQDEWQKILKVIDKPKLSHKWYLIPVMAMLVLFVVVERESKPKVSDQELANFIFETEEVYPELIVYDAL